MPSEIPNISSEEFNSWSSLSYKDLMAKVLRKFIDENEISTTELNGELLFSNKVLNFKNIFIQNSKMPD